MSKDPSGDGALPSDNNPLSRSNEGRPDQGRGSAYVCTCSLIEFEYASLAEEYAKQALSENTRRAYRTDLEHFMEWGGAIPSSPEQVADYLAAHAETHSIATLTRRLAAISVAHRAQGLESPTRDLPVQLTLRGIKRARGRPQRRVRPLLIEDLRSILDRLGDSLIDHRDAALLLVGFAGAFRRSELVGIDIEQLRMVREGIIITLAHSKTDQIGEGREIAIPYARGKHCPIKSLEAWMQVSCIQTGPLFRATASSTQINHARPSAEAVALTVKRHVASIGLDPTDDSGHSLRSGFATSAAAAGVSSWNIRRQTGHQSDAMLTRYIRAGGLFVDNPVGAIL